MQKIILIIYFIFSCVTVAPSSQNLVGLNRKYILLSYRLGEHGKLESALEKILQTEELHHSDITYALKMLGTIHALKKPDSLKAKVYFWRMLQNDPLADIGDLEDDPAVVRLFLKVKRGFEANDPSILYFDNG